MVVQFRQLRSLSRVLMVIDEPVLADVVTLALDHSNSLTQVAHDTSEAEIALREWGPDMAIVDVDLAQGEILDRLGFIRPVADRLPIVALTRRGDLQTKLAAFERGVDDILSIPFSPEELVARVLAVLRRVNRAPIAFALVLRLGELVIDILNRTVQVSGHEIHMTSLEQSLLCLFAANAGRLVTREEIMDQLWGADYVAESNVVDRHVSSLRDKLGDDWHRPRYIATVPGKGYRFLPPDPRAARTPPGPL